MMVAQLACVVLSMRLLHDRNPNMSKSWYDHGKGSVCCVYCCCLAGFRLAACFVKDV